MKLFKGLLQAETFSYNNISFKSLTERKKLTESGQLLWTSTHFERDWSDVYFDWNVCLMSELYIWDNLPIFMFTNFWYTKTFYLISSRSYCTNTRNNMAAEYKNNLNYFWKTKNILIFQVILYSSWLCGLFSIRLLYYLSTW